MKTNIITVIRYNSGEINVKYSYQVFNNNYYFKQMDQ